jgi:hypothetical protein
MPPNAFLRIMSPLFILQNGLAMRETRREQISKRLFSLLGFSAKNFQEERAAAPAASPEMGQTEALEVEDATDSRARARRGKGNARSLLALQ